MSWKNQISSVVLGVLFVARLLSSEPSPHRPHIWGISQVTILSTDVPTARTFYMKLLGEREGTCNWCERIPNNGFHVNRDQLVSLSSAPAPVPSDLLSEVTFVTDNVPELRRYFAAQKISVSEPAPRLDNALFVSDPEGHQIGFVLGRDPSTHAFPNPTGSANAVAMHIIHAGFIVRDRGATEHFYKDILGFRPYWHGGMKDDQTDWVSLQVPDGTDWVEFMVNVPENADQHLRGVMNHIALGVVDIHAAREQLVKNGVHLTEEPKLGRDGKWQLISTIPIRRA